MMTHRYHVALVVLHWLLGFMILLGLIMETFSLERLQNSQPEKSIVSEAMRSTALRSAY
jgi:hypothetical protein